MNIYPVPTKAMVAVWVDRSVAAMHAWQLGEVRRWDDEKIQIQYCMYVVIQDASIDSDPEA
jgi:hypothetical protein